MDNSVADAWVAATVRSAGLGETGAEAGTDPGVAVAAVADQFVWDVTGYAVVAIVAAVVALAFAVVMWRTDGGPGTLALTALALGAAWWSLLYGLELASGTLAAKLLFGRLEYLGIVLVPVSWFAFALAYTGRGDHLRPVSVGALLVPAALVAVLPWTSGSSDLFWASTGLVTTEAGTVLALEYGPAFWVWTAYSYTLVAVGSLLLLTTVSASARLFRTQVALLIVGVCAPWVANLSYLLRVTPEMLDPTPIGFVVSALALGSGLRRFRLLEVHPVARTVARDELVERMGDPIVVLNADGLIVDLNRRAREVLELEADAAVGTPLAAVTPDLAAAVAETPPDASEAGEMTVGTPPRHYELQVTTLRDGPRDAVGRLVTLHDVTDRRRREQRLAILNRVLRHDLRNDVATIQGGAELLIADPADERYAEIIADKAAEMLELLETVRMAEEALRRGSPTLAEVDIVKVVDEQVDAARRTYPDVDVETDLPATQPVYASKLIRSVVDNLIENAVEHNDSEVPHVRVSVDRVREDDRSYVAVSVADDGPGLPETDRGVLVGEAGDGLSKASGIGLWLVNWIVTESGGEVRYEPNDPRGSVVVLLLPSATDGRDPDARPPERDSARIDSTDATDATDATDERERSPGGPAPSA